MLRLFAVSCVTFLCMSGLTVGLSAGPAGAITAGVITTFTGGDIPEGYFWMGAGPDGNMWYADPEVGIDEVTPSGAFTSYANNWVDGGTCGTGCVAGPTSPTAGPFGDVWFINSNSNTIASLDPGTGAIVNYQIPAGQICDSDGFEPVCGTYGLTRGPGNSLWFQSNAEQLGELTFTQSCTSGNDVEGPTCTENPGFTWYNSPYAGETESTEGQAYGCGITGYTYMGALAQGPDGDMWLEDYYNMSLLRIDPNAPVGSQYTDFPMPTGTIPYGIDLQAGSDGLLWFYNYNSYPTDECDTPETPGHSGPASYDSFNPSTGALTSYTAPSVPDYTVPSATISGEDFAIGPDGNLWYTYQPYEYIEPGEPEVAYPAGVGELNTTTGSFTQYPDPAPGTEGDYNPSSIVAGANGEMWLLPGQDDCEGCGAGADYSIQEISTSVGTGTVNSVSPANGPDTGGATVWITGTGFTGATAVDFGSDPAASFSVIDDTTIEATTPAETDGTVTVTVTTAAGTTSSASDQYTFVPPILQSAPTTASVNAGLAYSGQLAVVGNTGAVTYTTTSGTSPVAVSSTGAVTAADTVVAGSYKVSGTDTDTIGDSGTWSFTLTVNANTITVTPGSASVNAGTAYSGQLVAHNNATTATFSQSGSSSPPGVTVSSSGAISAPDNLVAGSYTASGTVGDSLGDSGSWSFTVNVEAGTISTYPSLEDVYYGSAYSGQLSSDGNHGAVTYTQSSGTDVTVTSSGAVSAPEEPAGTYTASGSTSDPLGDGGTWNFSLNVLMMQEGTESGTVDTGAGYNAQLEMAGGTGALSYDQTYAYPDPGISVSASGAVSAPATLAAGTYYASGSVMDSLGNSSYWSFTLTVDAQPIVQVAPTSDTVDAGTPYSSQLNATPSAATVSYWQQSGSPQLTVSSSGAVSAPDTLAPGTYAASGYDTDSLGDYSGSWSFQLIVTPAVPGGTVTVYKISGLIGNYEDKITGTGWGANGDSSVSIYECAGDTYSGQCTSALATTSVETTPHSKAGDISVTVPIDAGIIDGDGDSCGMPGSGTCYLVALGSTEDVTASPALTFDIPQMVLTKTNNVLGNVVDKVSAKYFPIGDTVEASECNDAADPANLSSECDSSTTIYGTAGSKGTVVWSPTGTTGIEMQVGADYVDDAGDSCSTGSTCVVAVTDDTNSAANFEEVVNLAAPAVTVSPLTVTDHNDKTIAPSTKFFPVGDQVYAVECDSGLPGGDVVDNCDMATVVSGTAGINGKVAFSPTKIVVLSESTSTAYSDNAGGTCVAGGPSCYVAVYDVDNPDIGPAIAPFNVS